MRLSVIVGAVLCLASSTVLAQATSPNCSSTSAKCKVGNLQVTGNETVAGTIAVTGVLGLTNPSTSVKGLPFGLMNSPAGAVGRWGWGSTSDNDASALTFVGMVTGAVTGTASDPGPLAGQTRKYIQHASVATTNSAAGYAWSSAAEVYGNSGWAVAAVWRCAETTAERIWFSMATATLIAVAVPTASTANVNNYAGIGFDPAVSANFIGASGDGTNNSGTSMGVAPVAQHEYVMLVDNFSELGTAVNYYVLDITSGTLTSLRKTSNLPTATTATDYAMHITVTTLENVTKNMQLNSVGVFSRW